MEIIAEKKANFISRAFFILSLFFILPVFITPIWQIELEAPQYPEGLTMFIHYNTVTGAGENDLENINLLNHYIGMKRIEPDSIPELQYMKYILIALLVLGAISALVGKRSGMAVWFTVSVVLGVAGIYDLNRWESDYGRDLDPRAPIRIEGATYKPPLFGEKQLLNITARSYPYTGGVCFAFAIFISGLSVFMAYRTPTHEESSAPVDTGSEHQQKDISMQEKGRLSALSLPATRMGKLFHLPAWIKFMGCISLFFLYGCTAEPQAIRYGHDQCAHCSMIISDHKFGSELVTMKGKIYKFDSVECMIWFLNSGYNKGNMDFKYILTTDCTRPGEWIDASRASYLISKDVPSPMGAFLSAYENSHERDKIDVRGEGEKLDWVNLRERFSE
ncbi:MAG: nitrous oxide reductase accessory protein NosL [Bacteroidia bacterium]|nr:nitrous oxide reductase accessory protein NosL [Bacteroidia bacterium]